MSKQERNSRALTAFAILVLSLILIGKLCGCSASVTAGGAKASTEHVVDRPTVTTRTLEGTNIDPAVAQAFFNLGKKK